MGRATLKEVTARKAATCQTGGEPIKPGDKYWKLEAFRRSAKFCHQHQPSDEQVRHFAPQSRADRASEAADSARSAGSELDDISNDAKALAEKVQKILDDGDEDEAAKEPSAATKKKAEEVLREGVKELSQRVAGISYDLSEVESLAEEIGNWRDGMSGTGLENTGKYSEVEDCASELEGIETEPVDVSSLDEKASLEDLESFADECEEASSGLDSAADEIEGISFPGMY
jgi:seryl-tRNA synthetase